MDESLSAENLVHYFERHVYNLDHDLLNEYGEEDLGRVGGAVDGATPPQRPVVVFFVGEHAVCNVAAMHALLAAAWPRHHHLGALRFFGLTREGDISRLFEFEFGAGEPQQKEMNTFQVGKRIDELNNYRFGFHDLRSTDVHYMIDTKGYQQPSDLASDIALIKQMKDEIGIASTEASEMLFLLLDESRQARKLAADIKNMLAVHANNDNNNDIFGSLPVVLLSSRRSDNQLVDESDERQRVVAALIRLTNGTDDRLSARLFGAHCVLTAGYARMDKPLKAIGTVVLREFQSQLEELQQTQGNTAAPSNDADLSVRLGITDEGTHVVLDDYVTRELVSALPTSDQLELLPRKSMEYHSDLTSLSENDFNELTMNTWNALIERIVSQALDELHSSDEARAAICRAYGKYLFDTFTTDELIDLDSPGRKAYVRGLFDKNNNPKLGAHLLERAKLRLRRKLLNDADLVALLLNALHEQAEQARAYRGALNSFNHSFVFLDPVADTSIESFYRQKVQNYVDHNRHELLDAYRKVRTVDELREFFQQQLNRIIDSDGAFVVSFERELALRLDTGNQTQAQQAEEKIKDDLIVQDPPRYFRAIFSMGTSIVSALMLKQDTSLYDNLIIDPQIAAVGTSFYNTGDGSAAERIEVFKVAAENLIS